MEKYVTTFLLFLIQYSVISASESKYYNYKSIEFSENGFPKVIKIAIYGFKENEVHPSQVFVTDDTQMLQSLKGNITVSENNDVIFEVVLNFEDYLPLDFFDPDDPYAWTLNTISGSKMIIPENVKFVPIIVSNKYLIGIALSDLGNDDFINKWRKSMER